MAALTFDDVPLERGTGGTGNALTFDDVPRDVPRAGFAQRIRAAQDAQSRARMTHQAPARPPAVVAAPLGVVGNVALGVGRGARDLVDGPAYLLAKGFDRIAGTNEARRVSDINEQAEDAYQAATPDSLAAGAARVLANVGTAFVPGTGQMRAAQAVNRLWKADGVANKAKSLGVAAGVGAAQSAILNTKTEDDSLLQHAALGAALAPTAQLAQAVAGRATQAVRNLREGPPARQGETLVRASQVEDPRALASAIRAGNVEIVPGSAPTTAQTVKNSGLSQLQRTTRNNSYVPFNERIQAQDAARMRALEGIAPGATSRTSIEAAEDAGNVIHGHVAPEYAATTQRVSDKFESVDPFRESRVDLPVHRVKILMAQRYGPGAGKPDDDLMELVGDIERLQTEKIDASLTHPDVLGYMRGMANEAGWFQPGGRVIRDGAIDARTGFQDGDVVGRTKWVPKADWWRGAPKGGGEAPYRSAVDKLEQGLGMGAMNADERRAVSFMLGEIMENNPNIARQVAELNARTGVPHEVFQRLRSRATEMSEVASSHSKKNKATVAGKIAEILTDAMDEAAARTTAGQNLPHEYFSQDMADAWRDAIAARREQGLRYETTPSREMWLKEVDGVTPRRQGAEIPRAFFGPYTDQAARMDQFWRMTPDNPDTANALRGYAISDLAQRGGTTDGTLTATRVGNWLDTRSEAIARLFDQDQQAVLGKVRADLDRAFSAENLGRATGSNTEQNRIGSAFLNSPLARLMANYLPRTGSAILEALRIGDRSIAVEEIGEVMTDPDIAARALDVYARLMEPNLLQRGLRPAPIYAVPGSNALIGEE